MSKELAETTISYAWTDDKTTFMVKIEGIPTNKEAGFPMAFVAHNLFEVAHDIALSTIKDRSHLKKFSLPELLGVLDRKSVV